MKQDVTTFIQNCKDCARRKTGHKVKAPLGEIPAARDFFRYSIAGHCGTPSSDRKREYLLTFIDHYALL